MTASSFSTTCPRESPPSLALSPARSWTSGLFCAFCLVPRAPADFMLPRMGVCCRVVSDLTYTFTALVITHFCKQVLDPHARNFPVGIFALNNLAHRYLT